MKKFLNKCEGHRAEIIEMTDRIEIFYVKDVINVKIVIKFKITE